jgi:arginase
MIYLKGIPYDHNSSFLRGPSYAPNRIRLMDTEGSANNYAESGMTICNGETYIDAGDIEFTNSNPAEAFSQIKTAIEQLLTESNKVLSLGGDHSVSYPVISAYMNKYADLTILHFDAHADLYDSFDDNPFSHASPFARIMETGNVKQLIQIGIRTLTKQQREQISRFNIKTIEMAGIAEAIPVISSVEGSVYISLDLDVLDPAFAPGVSHHEPGGVNTRELIQMLHVVKAEIIGADIVEYNPMRDINNVTAMVAYKLMKELISLM